MKLRRLFSLAILMLLPLLSNAATDPNSSTAAGQQLIQLLGNLQAMQAGFTQVISDSSGGTIQNSSGTMALQRPGKFLWSVRTPNPQLVIVNGKEVITYQPDLRQAVIQPLNNANMADTPAFLLTGSTDQILNTFSITTMNKSGPGVWYQLTPKASNSLFHSVSLNFVNNQLTKMNIKDNLGQETHVSFNKVKYNPSLNGSIFQFTPPKGVDVVRQ